jgi:hypothetical protein
MPEVLREINGVAVKANGKGRLLTAYFPIISRWYH